MTKFRVKYVPWGICVAMHPFWFMVYQLDVLFVMVNSCIICPYNWLLAYLLVGKDLSTFRPFYIEICTISRNCGMFVWLRILGHFLIGTWPSSFLADLLKILSRTHLEVLFCDVWHWSGSYYLFGAVPQCSEEIAFSGR